MARKAKRRPPARARRPAAPGAAAPAAPAAPRPPGTSRPQGGVRAGGDQALVRSVEMALAPGTASRRGGRVVLESADPAIPLDRVPYFLSDLARLGVVAAAMVALLVLGALLVIPLVVR